MLVGSSQQRLPAPFGLAEAGLVAYSLDGDIVVVDPASNQRRTIVAGDTDDRDPQWSRDGTRIVFERYRDGLSQLFTVRPDGAGLTAITPNPTTIDAATLTARPTRSRRTAAAVLYLSGSAIRIAQSDGTGDQDRSRRRSIDLVEVAWRPPDGSQIGAVGAARRHLPGRRRSTARCGPLSHQRMESKPAACRGLPMARRSPTTPGRPRPRSSPSAHASWTSRADMIDWPTREAPTPPGMPARRGRTTANGWSFSAAIASGYADVTAVVVRADGTGPRVETEHGLVLDQGVLRQVRVGTGRQLDPLSPSIAACHAHEPRESSESPGLVEIRRKRSALRVSRRDRGFVAAPSRRVRSDQLVGQRPWRVASAPPTKMAGTSAAIETSRGAPARVSPAASPIEAPAMSRSVVSGMP